jgi:hypothetical protein
VKKVDALGSVYGYRTPLNGTKTMQGERLMTAIWMLHCGISTLPQ